MLTVITHTVSNRKLGFTYLKDAKKYMKYNGGPEAYTVERLTLKKFAKLSIPLVNVAALLLLQYKEEENKKLAKKLEVWLKEGERV
jgi:intein/homing endonuclease